MAKVIRSPSKRWPGTVTLADPMNYDQVRAIESGLDEGAKTEPSAYMSLGGSVEMIWSSKLTQMKLPAIFACVEKWDLENFPEDVNELTFPATPRGAANELSAWLFGEMMKVYYGEMEIKNE